MLPQDGEHNKVLTQLICDVDTVPPLRVRSTHGQPKAPTGRWGKSGGTDVSHGRDGTSTVPPVVFTYRRGRIFPRCAFALFNTTLISMSASGDGGCAGFWYTHAHNEAFPWQQKCHKSYLKNSLGLCNK